jgi:hypothetical protein
MLNKKSKRLVVINGYHLLVFLRAVAFPTPETSIIPSPPNPPSGINHKEELLDFSDSTKLQSRSLFLISFSTSIFVISNSKLILSKTHTITEARYLPSFSL